MHEQMNFVIIPTLSFFREYYCCMSNLIDYYIDMYIHMYVGTYVFYMHLDFVNPNEQNVRKTNSPNCISTITAITTATTIFEHHEQNKWLLKLCMVVFFFLISFHVFRMSTHNLVVLLL